MVKNNPIKERRQHVRIPARFAVMMKLDKELFPDYTMEGEILNVSEGGLLLSLPDKRKTNGDIQDRNIAFYYGDLNFESLMTWIQFVLPTDDEPLRILGRPTWVNRPNGQSKECLLAMKFTHISQEDHNKLLAFIRESNNLAS